MTPFFSEFLFLRQEVETDAIEEKQDSHDIDENNMADPVRLSAPDVYKDYAVRRYETELSIFPQISGSSLLFPLKGRLFSQGCEMFATLASFTSTNFGNNKQYNNLNWENRLPADKK